MLTWTPLIAAHALAAGLAVPLGALALLARPGSRLHKAIGARLHKAMGYAWAVLMLVAALTGAFIRDFGLPNINGYTPIHLLVVVTVVTVPLGVWLAITRRFEAHRRVMLNTYWGACIVAGAFTLLPSRLIGRWLWHDTLGITPATLGLAQGILKATPMWVWVLLVVLLSVGAQQLSTRKVGLKRAMMFPVAMLGLSAFGVFSAFGAGLAAAVWAATLAVLLPAFAKVPMTRGVRWDDWREQFQVPGSVIPLGVIFTVFTLKYTVGVKLGFNPALAHDFSFALPVAAAYGAVNAMLTARAWMLWRLAHPSAQVPRATLTA
jgi:uncharacterized membrane protein